jgi:hypothetical protein
MSSGDVVLAVIAVALLGFIIMVVWLVYELRQGNVEGAAALFGTWIALTIVSIGVELGVFFVLDHTLLFTLGTQAAGIGLVVAGLVIFATPIVWAVVIRHRAHSMKTAH